MVISREPKTCFKLKSPDRARNLSLLSGNKGKRRIPTGMLLRFLFLYIYNSFFPLENNELVKLISNSEPPPCTNYLSSPKLSKFVQSSRPLDFEFPNFWLIDSSSRSKRSKIEIPFHGVAFSLPSLIGKPSERYEGRLKAEEGWIRGGDYHPRSAIRGFRKRGGGWLTGDECKRFV